MTRRLPADEVHVWLCALDRAAEPEGDGAPADALAETLSPPERERADRLRRPRDAARHVVAHGLKREILAAYADAPPADLRFETGEHGKPRIVAPASASDQLRFNLAHSGGLMLLAASASEVGVDLEQTRDLSDLEGMLERCLGPEELAAFDQRVPDGRRREAFYRVWTRKEAWLKATGRGLTAGLRSVAVTVDPDRPPELVSDDDGDAGDAWLRDVALPEGWAGAVAGLGSPPRSVRCRRWTSSGDPRGDALPGRNSPSSPEAADHDPRTI